MVPPLFPFGGTMQFYQAKIRLGGSLLNEVFKPDLSAPEIMLLREFHGSDAVVDIKRTRTTPRPSEEERERLMSLYMGSSNNDPEQVKAKNGIWFALFGHLTAELPTKLPGEWPEIEQPPVISEAPRVGKRALQRAAREAEANEPAETAESPLE